MLRIEQLAHGDRRGALLPQEAEVVVLLGRERVFEEEGAILFQVLAELDRLAGRDPFVNVVEQLDVIAEVGPQVLEQLGDLAHVAGRLPRSASGIERADRRLTRFRPAGHFRSPTAP